MMDLKWLLFSILMAMDGLVMVAAVTKYVEVKRASLWAGVLGTVVSSHAEARTVTSSSRSGSDRTVDTEIRNFASVSYVFKADGRTVSGNRISIGHDVGNYHVAEKLAKYPVGATVTVYYDRNKPADNVLERELSARSFEITFLIGALVAVLGIFALLLTEDVGALVAQVIPHNGRTSGGFFIGTMGLLAATFGWAFYQQGAVTFTWPKVTGLVDSSATDAVQLLSTQDSGYTRSRTAFRSRTIYSYVVNGMRYQSDRVSFGAQVYATFRFLARRAAGRFEPGQAVEVFYNPRRPEQAVLVRGAPGQWLIWVVAIAFLVVAGRLLGLI